MSKRYSSAKLTALVTAGTIALLAPQDAAAVTGHDAKIRPGVMVGDSDNPSDFFLDLFVPVIGSERGFAYINPHFRYADGGSNEQNIGLGFRAFTPGDSAIVGLNVFFDSMESEWSNRFEQWGVGAELLTEWFDLRANYYKPFSDTIQDVPSLSRYIFTSTSLLYQPGMEEAVEGFDVEVGAMIPGISKVFETRAFIGGYWYDSTMSAEDPEGWKFRLEVKLSKLIHLEAEYADDDVWDGRTFIGGYLDIPFSFEKGFEGFGEAAAFGTGARTLKERMTQKVVRDRHIQTVSGPWTETPLPENIIVDGGMIFVNKDNTDDPDQDGSLSHPWESVENAENLDDRWADPEPDADPAWVYVFNWDDTEDNIFSGTSVNLIDNMKLWGEGYYHPDYHLGGTNGANDPAKMPTLDGEGAQYVIGLADNNEVMGLTIQNAGHGIYGENITSTNIHDNTIQDNISIVNSGIHIQNSFDSADMSGQTLRYLFANNIIANNSGTGIYLENEIYGEESLDDFNIITEFTDNEIYGTTAYGGGPGAGIYVNNDISLVKYAYGGVSDSLSITNSGISNTFDGNDIHDNDAIGVYVENNFTADMIRGGDAYGGATLASSITNTHISNTFTENEVTTSVYNDEYGGGLAVFNMLGADPIVTGDATGSTTITASVIDSSISNTFTSNTITFEGGTTGNGIDIENEIYAYNYADNVGAVGYGEAINITASVSGSSITNTLDGNTVTYEDGAYGGNGIYIQNDLSAENEIGADAYGSGYIGFVYGGGMVGVTASVENSGITNDIGKTSGNTVDFGYGGTIVDGGSGIEIDNSLSAVNNIDQSVGMVFYGGAVDITASATGSGIDNTINNNVVDHSAEGEGIGIYNEFYVDNNIYGSVGFVGYGDAVLNITASATDSGITNTLNNNDVAFGANSGSNGIDVDNWFDAENDLDGDVGLVGYGNGVVNITAAVYDSGITNILNNNDITYDADSYGGTGINLDNNYLYATNYITGTVSNVGYGGAVNMTASVENSSITNSLDNNTIDAGYGGGTFGGGDGIDIYNKLYADNTIYGSIEEIYYGGTVAVTSSVTGSDITNTLSNNDVTFHDYADGSDGIDIGNYLYADPYVREIQGVYGGTVNLTATVEDSGITNELTDNTVTFGSDTDGRGIDIRNSLNAENYVDWGSGVGYVSGAVTIASSVTGSDITNTLAGNEVTYQDDSNGGWAGIELDSYLSAEGYIGSGIRNVGYGGTVAFTSSVEDSGITNGITDNTVTFGSSSDGEGIDIYSDLYAASFISSNVENIGYGGGEIVTIGASVSGSDITNTLNGNDITYEDGSYGGSGIMVYSNIEGEGYISGSIMNMGGNAQVGATAYVEDSNISNSFYGNTVDFGYDGGAFNVRDGIEIDNHITAQVDVWNGIENIYDDAVVDVTAYVSGSGIENELTDNTVTFHDYADGNQGIDIWNNLDADVFVSGSASQIIGGEVSLTAYVNPSSITNTLRGNEVTFGVETDGEGIIMGSSLTATTEFCAGISDVAYGGVVNLTSYVEDSSINNTLVDNAVTYEDGSYGGTGFDIYNNISAEFVIDDEIQYLNDWGSSPFDTFTAVNATAYVDNSSINNTLSALFDGEGNLIAEGNSVTYGSNSDGTGIAIDNYLNAEGSLFLYNNGIYDIDNSAKVNISTSVTNSEIANSLVHNDVIYQDNAYGGGTGITLRNELSAAITMSSAGEGIEENDNGSIVSFASSVENSTISNTLAENSVTYNSMAGGKQTGIGIENRLFAINDLNYNSADIQELDDYAEVNFTASVTDSSISNTLTDNSVGFGSSSGGDGINIGNELYSENGLDDIQGDWWGSGIEDGSKVTSSATVDGSSIENTLTDNSVDYAANSYGGSGIYLDNEMWAYQEVDRINDIYGSTVDLSVSVTNSGISNTLNASAYGNGNMVTYGANSGGDGIYIENDIDADIDVWDDIESVYGGTVNLIGSVEDSSISNTLEDTTVTYAANSYGGNGIAIANDLDAYIYHENDPDDIYYGSAVDLSATVTGSSIDNMLARTEVIYESTNAYGGAATAIDITNELHATVDIWDGGVDNVAYVSEVNLTAGVADSSISNTLNDTSITYGSNTGGTAIDIANELYANIYQWDSVNDLYDSADVTMTASVSDSSITNTLSENDDTITYEEGSYGGTAIDIDNELYAEVYVNNYADWFWNGSSLDVTASVTGSDITNELTNNTVNSYGGTGININNYLNAEGYNGIWWWDIYDSYVDVNAYIEESGITNTLTGNTLDGGNAGWEGIDINNWVELDVYPEGEGANWVSDVSIVNNFTDNEISNFNDDAIRLDSEIFSDDGDMVNVSISTTADGNILSNNGEDGFAVRNTIYANDGSVYGGVETFSFRGNTITGNDGEGINLTSSSYDVDVLVTMFGNVVANNLSEGVYLNQDGFANLWSIDLGTYSGSLTSGYNSFYGNSSGADLYNNTGQTVDAKYNWWGDTYAGDQITDSWGWTYYEPELVTDPNL